MTIRRQTQVMANMDEMAGRAMGEIAKRYRRETIGPLADTIGKATSVRDLLKRMNPALLRRMKSEGLEEAAAQVRVQAAMVGRATAKPSETSKRRKVETSK